MADKLNLPAGFVLDEQESVSSTPISSLPEGFVIDEQPQQQDSFRDPSTVDSQPEESPITILDRLKLGFSDDEGKENFLKEKFAIVERLPNGKFAAGDNPNELLPIDPEGIFNDVIGDIADIAGEIPVIAGQMMGSVAGGTAGSIVPGAGTAAGTIAGGAAGAGLGEAAKIGIGRALGVREQKAMEEATDIAISSAFGAAGEGLAKGVQLGGKFLGKAITKKMAKAIDKTMKVDEFGVPLAQDAPLKVKTLAKTLKILANVPEESTETVMRHGVEKTLGNPAHMKKTGVIKVVKNTINALEEVTERLGKDVGKQVKALEKAARLSGKSSRIQVDDMFPALKKQAQDIGILDDFGRLNKNLPFEARDAKPILSLLNEFGSFKNGVYSLAPGKTMPVRKAVITGRLFGNKFEKLTPQGQAALKETMDIFRGKITQKANELGVKNFAVANDKYSKFLDLKAQLKQLNPKKLDGMERFVKGLERQGQFTRQNLRDLQSMSKVDFLDNWEMWNAAQDFVGANPNMLRFGMIAGTLGLTSGFDTTESKLATFGGAALLGTPSGARTVLRGLAKVGGVPRTATGAARKTLDTKATSAILSRLLRSRTSNEEVDNP